MSQQKKEKLLVLVDWFAPGYKAGGPIQSCVNLCRVLARDYDIYVLTTDTDHGETTSYHGINPNEWLYNQELGVNVYYAKKKALSARQLAEQIESVDAGFVYLNHLFSPMFVVYPLWLKLIGKIKGRVVVCPRGALYQSALSLKGYKKMPLLLLYKYLGISKKVKFHATNDREAAAITKHFPAAEIIIADNLPNTKQTAFTSIPKQSGHLACIFIARIVPIKNLLYLLKILQQVKGTVTLTVVGPVENEDYWKECNTAITALPSNVTVNYIGPQKNETLAALIQLNHLFILPTTGENFGHSIFEALLAGRPVLISDQTPWLNLQAQHAGWDISLHTPSLFEAVINTAIHFNQHQFDEYALGAWKFADDFIVNSKSKQQYTTLFS
jgi:glycosyltransferase involved in cell wall biosynthesis